jgi:hypothetical protein
MSPAYSVTPTALLAPSPPGAALASTSFHEQQTGSRLLHRDSRSARFPRRRRRGRGDRYHGRRGSCARERRCQGQKSNFAAWRLPDKLQFRCGRRSEGAVALYSRTNEMLNTSRLLLILLVAPTLVAQDIPPRSAFEQVLLPVTSRQQVHGAYGTDWRVELALRNASTEPVHVFRHYRFYFCIDWPTPCAPRPMLPPRTVADESWTGFAHAMLGPGGGQGAFIYIPKDQEDIFINLHLFERSFGHQSEGVEVPVVRSDEMLLHPVELLNISTNPSGRRLLRVFAAPPLDVYDVLMHARVYPLHGDEVLAEIPLTLARRDPAETHPHYAEAGIDHEQWPLLATADAIRVRIEPVSHPGVPYWAMVSITDNATQHVTLVTPN